MDTARLAPWQVTVSCEHGETTTPWRRACRNGCHLAAPERAAGCLAFNPSRQTMATVGVVHHGRRLRCGCDRTYWMRYGPDYGKETPAFGIQTIERRLPEDELEEMKVSVQQVKGWPPC